MLDAAVDQGCAVVLGAAGAAGMPASAEERVANSERIVGEAVRRDIGLAMMYVDLLVLPVAVQPDVGLSYLEAVRAVRARYGSEMHITGGLSNVSFGLPMRNLLNQVFIDLAIAAGADSGIIDPVASDSARIFSQDRAARAYAVAADLLEGRDPYGMTFLAAYRNGELG